MSYERARKKNHMQSQTARGRSGGSVDQQQFLLFRIVLTFIIVFYRIPFLCVWGPFFYCLPFSLLPARLMASLNTLRCTVRCHFGVNRNKEPLDPRSNSFTRPTEESSRRTPALLINWEPDESAGCGYLTFPTTK